MSKKKKSFIPTSDLMADAFELLLKSDKFIVIGEYFDGNGIMSVIHHETDNINDTSQKLKDWHLVMKEKADHHDQLRDILGESGIEEF